MSRVLDSPFFVLAIAMLVQVISVYAGDLIRERFRSLKDDERDSFSIVEAAALTLLALIIGFSFSMAVSRYDQRKK